MSLNTTCSRLLCKDAGDIEMTVLEIHNAQRKALLAVEENYVEGNGYEFTHEIFRVLNKQETCCLVLEISSKAKSDSKDNIVMQATQSFCLLFLVILYEKVQKLIQSFSNLLYPFKPCPLIRSPGAVSFKLPTQGWRFVIRITELGCRGAQGNLPRYHSITLNSLN